MTDETKQFLRIGIDAYHPGLTAFARFRAEIYRGAKRSMTRNFPMLSAATKLQLKADEVGPYAEPRDLDSEIDEWDQSLANVGAKLTVKEGKTHIHAAIGWEVEDMSANIVTTAWVGFEAWSIPGRKMIEAAAKKAEPDNQVHSFEYDVWLQQEVSADDVSNFESILDNLFVRWTAVFEGAGGFPIPIKKKI
jgi:hypothetical protein